MLGYILPRVFILFCRTPQSLSHSKVPCEFLRGRPSYGISQAKTHKALQEQVQWASVTFCLPGTLPSSSGDRCSWFPWWFKRG